MSLTKSPSVGIFWLVTGDDGQPELVSQRTALEDGDRYGECIGHPTGHYEAWSCWQQLGPGGLRRAGLPQSIFACEYETHPRGRIVFSLPEQAFWIYADKRLQSAHLVSLIKRHFGLDHATCRVRSDAHYR